MVVSTWPFVEAVDAAWRSVDGGSSAVDAVVEGCSACEVLRCDGTGKGYYHLHDYYKFMNFIFNWMIKLGISYFF